MFKIENEFGIGFCDSKEDLEKMNCFVEGLREGMKRGGVIMEGEKERREREEYNMFIGDLEEIVEEVEDKREFMIRGLEKSKEYKNLGMSVEEVVDEVKGYWEFE